MSRPESSIRGVIGAATTGYPVRTKTKGLDGMTSEERGPRPSAPAEGKRAEKDPYGETPEAQRETVRGEQGTSSGDPHDDRDPQSG
jgi:hypothetical protein